MVREITLYRDAIVFKKLHFQNVRRHKNENMAFLNSSCLKSVTEWTVWTVWTVGLTVEMKKNCVFKFFGSSVRERYLN